MKPKSLKKDSWYDENKNLFEHKKFAETIKKFIAVKNTISPAMGKVLNCFNFFEFNETKVVFVFLSPYQSLYQEDNKFKRIATGLATGTPTEKIDTPTLKMIREALANDCYDIAVENSFDWTMEHWAKQDILLLNRALTVDINGDARKYLNDWTWFTAGIIKNISDKLENVVFVFFGNSAKELSKVVDPAKHTTIETMHPVKMWYEYKKVGFNLQKIDPKWRFDKEEIFKKVNTALKNYNKNEIKWLLEK